MSRVLVRTPTDAVKMDLLQGPVGFSPAGAPAHPLQSQQGVLVMDVDDAERRRIETIGGVIYEDVQFETFPGHGTRAGSSSTTATNARSLRDVVDQVGAPMAWSTTRGGGATIAIIDTGISSALIEVPSVRRSPHNMPTVFHGHHWVDPVGHGSMCAAIAAGSTSGGGRYDGVAPDATVLSIRSDLTAVDLTIAYDELVRLRTAGALTGPLVVSNSYGVRSCRPPGVLPARHPFITGIDAAIDAGIFVCFAAGNNHQDLCSFDPKSCKPSTIWGANSHDRVVSVGTVNRDLTNQDKSTPHVNSSRGPGEWASNAKKPDCVAPTYGEVPWGSTYRVEPWWGTSGACPQVAGAAALILSVAPRLDPATVAHLLRTTCKPLLGGTLCVGHGLLDCSRAVEAALAIL